MNSFDVFLIKGFTLAYLNKKQSPVPLLKMYPQDEVCLHIPTYLNLSLSLSKKTTMKIH